MPRPPKATVPATSCNGWACSPRCWGEPTGEEFGRLIKTAFKIQTNCAYYRQCDSHHHRLAVLVVICATETYRATTDACHQYLMCGHGCDSCDGCMSQIHAMNTVFHRRLSAAASVQLYTNTCSGHVLRKHAKDLQRMLGMDTCCALTEI
jgi:hypothetical protein